MLPMIVPIIQIGNSRGIRLPKAVLEQCRITDRVDIEVHKGNITVRPYNNPREGWAEQMKKMHERHEDGLLIPDTVDLDFEGWEW